MPRWSARRAWASTQSSTVTMGKSEPHGFPVAGLIDAGPVEPKQPPRLLTPTAKKRAVSTGLPGPTILSHHPSLAGWPAYSPATWCDALSAWQTRIALERSALSVPYVSYINSNAGSVAPDESRSGSPKDARCGCTMPTEPGAAVTGCPIKKPDQLALIGSVNWEKQPRRFSRICRKSGIAGLPSRPQADRQIGASRLVYRRAARCQFQRHRSTIRG